MQSTLVLAVLNINSSYFLNVEETLDGDEDIPDTLQWWIATESAWRIKTFAIDHDIHVYSVGHGNDELVLLAQSNNTKHYGDVIECQHVLKFNNCEETGEVQQVFREYGIVTSP